MKLNIPFYRQSTTFTCDPACVIMALKYFYPETKFYRELEFTIWRESYGIGIPGCMPQGLAYSALSRGLNATLICKKKGLVQISKKLAQGENRKITSFTSKDLLKKAKEKGMKIINKDPELNDIENALVNEQIPLAMMHMNLLHSLDSPHWIVVTGIDNENVWINDPYNKKGKDVKISRNHLIRMVNDLKKYSKIEKRMLLISKGR